MDDASERAIEEDMLDQFNYFDDEDEELIDRREPASLDSFDLVDEETDEVEDESTESPQSSRLDSLLSRAPMHHGVRAGALHMKTDWHQIVTAGDELAVDAPLTDKSSIICRTGMLMLASGTGAWRVRDTMNRVAAVLGVTVHVDLSLLSFECTCIEDGHCFNEVVSLPTTGVNTHRIWMMESFLKRRMGAGLPCTNTTRCSRPLRVQNPITLPGNRALRQLVLAAPSSFCSAAALSRWPAHS